MSQCQRSQTRFATKPDLAIADLIYSYYCAYVKGDLAIATNLDSRDLSPFFCAKKKARWLLFYYVHDFSFMFHGFHGTVFQWTIKIHGSPTFQEPRWEVPAFVRAQQAYKAQPGIHGIDDRCSHSERNCHRLRPMQCRSLWFGSSVDRIVESKNGES